MKRAVFLLTVLALTGVGAAVAYEAAERERAYRAQLTRGDAALRDDQTFAAIEAYSGAIALRPDSTIAYLKRGETYARRGDLEGLEKAAHDFRNAAALDPAAPRPVEDLGDVLYQRQRYGMAADTFDRCRALDDRSARVTYKLALARYREGALDDVDSAGGVKLGAVSAAMQAVRLDPKSPQAYYLLGVCLREKRRYTDAQQAIDQAVTLSPGLIPAREELVDLYALLGRRSDELEQLQLIAGLDRTRVERQVGVALAHARAGRALGASPAAIRELNLAVLTLGSLLERTPDQPLIYGALGRVWLDIAQKTTDRAESKVDLSKALEALERVSASPSATSDVLTVYGQALLMDQQIDAAERSLQLATERFPIEPTAFLWLATAAERLNHHEPARAALLRYLALEDNDPEFVAHATRIAALSLGLNDVGTAIEWLQKIAAVSPNDARVLASLADAQIRYGDYAAAKATVAKGLEKDPSSAALISLQRRVK